MNKIAIIISADTTTIESMGRISNAFVLASEAIENKDELKLFLEGASVKWIGELENEKHMLHKLYKSIKPHISGACKHCSEAFGETSKVKNAGINLVGEYQNHPSIRNLIINGYQVISY